MIFYDFTMSEKREIFRYDFLWFFVVEFMIFFDEFYDLVSLGFEEKSRKTQKNNHKKKNI